MSKSSKPTPRSEQSQAFIEAARKLGCDDDPAHFDEILKKVARHKPPFHVRPAKETKDQVNNYAYDDGRCYRVHISDNTINHMLSSGYAS